MEDWSPYNGGFWPYDFVQVVTDDFFVITRSPGKVISSEGAVFLPVAELVRVVRNSAGCDSFGGL